MKKIILFTKMSSILKHWQNALEKTYLTVAIEDFDALVHSLKENQDPIIVLFDEMSVSDIYSSLQKLKECNCLIVLLFNAIPEVHHASTLLKEGIKGYENSYIHKDNLLKMISSVENGNSWFFSDLTHFIINKYVKNIDENEPDFMHILTEREKDIALMIAHGLNNKEIAQREKIALSTVKGHIHHIFEKAGVSDRISLALKFR